MFFRFVHPKTIEQTAARRGFFCVAYEAVVSPDIEQIVATEIQGHLAWFKSNLRVPPNFSRTNSKGAYQREFTLGLSWFRADAQEMLDRAWDLTWLLREQGYVIDVIRSEKIGYVIYEDKFQVVAEPFQDTPK